jgi:hypothetical protein
MSARAEPAAVAVDLWGVGCYDAPAGRLPWPIGNEEIARDMGHASTRLRELGIGAGDRVLFCSLLSEAGQFWPWIVGTMLSGAQLSCADATTADAARVAVLLRHVPFRAVIGVDDSLLDGCDERELAYDALFDGVDVLAARPGAYERLAATGLAPHRFALCGPAIALGHAPGTAATVFADEWRLDEGTADGEVLVTNLAPRATTFERTVVATRGHVTDAGKGITWPSAR